MLDLFAPQKNAAGGWTRRKFLSVGSLCLGGLSLADCLQLQAQQPSSAPRRNRSVIVLWTHGGPSHLETFDMKPDAPSSTRSMFNPIRTNVPGVDVCELLPKLARLAEKFTLLRSVAHDEADHGFGTRRFCTGYGRMMPGSNNGLAYFPSMETVVFRELGMLQDGLPTSVNLGPFRASTPWRGPGFYGPKYDVPEYYTHPANGQVQGIGSFRMRVSPDRFDERRHLLGQFDQFRADLDTRGTVDAMDEYRRQAFETIGNARTLAAFDLTNEHPQVREKYNACGFGQDLLLARRLVEAGVRFVNVYIGGQPYGSGAAGYNWDDHAVNWDLPRAMRNRLPWYDHIVSTLLEDIHQRGLEDEVLVIVTGEFGRSPRIEHGANGNFGRDHWPSAMSILVSGGGRRRGDIIGATNSRGEHPVSRAYDPHDVLATIYHYLGIDPRKEHLDLTGRPIVLARGEPIAGLV
jgi:hypothetical protein